MPTLSYFPTPIYSELEFNHPELKLDSLLDECNSAIMKSFKQLNRPWDENVLSSFSQTSTSNFLADTPLLKEYITFHVDRYLCESNDVKNHPFKCNFLESWYNIFPENGYMHFHTHGFFDISGAFYVDATGDGSDGVFCMRADSTGLRSCKFLMRGGLDAAITPKKGSLILFPSYMQHAVSTNKTKKDRISISFNIGLY